MSLSFSRFLCSSNSEVLSSLNAIFKLRAKILSAGIHAHTGNPRQKKSEY